MIKKWMPREDTIREAVEAQHRICMGHRKGSREREKADRRLRTILGVLFEVEDKRSAA